MDKETKFIITPANVEKAITDKTIPESKLVTTNVTITPQFAVGGFDRASTAGTGTQEITTNFQPRLIILQTTCTEPGGWTGWSYGTATGTSDESCAGYARSSGGTWERIASNTYIAFVWDDGESLNSKASINSISTTSFTLNWITMGVDVHVSWSAWGY